MTVTCDPDGYLRLSDGYLRLFDGYLRPEFSETRVNRGL